MKGNSQLEVVEFVVDWGGKGGEKGASS